MPSFRSMFSFAPWTIGGTLRLLIIGCIFPLWLAGALAIYYAYLERLESTKKRLVETSHALTLAVDREFKMAEAALLALAASRDLGPEREDLVNFHRQAIVVSNQLGANNISLVNDRGLQVVNTLYPFTAPPLPRSRPETMRNVFTSGKTVIGNSWVGPTTKRLLFSVDVPIIQEGRVVYDLTVSVPANRMQELLQSQNLSPQTLGAIADGDNIVMARMPRPEMHVGKTASKPIVEALADSREGTVEFNSFDNIKMTGAFSQTKRSNWIVLIAIPSNTMISEVFIGLWPLIVLNLLISIIAVISGIFLSRRLVLPFQRLVGPALALGDARPVVVPRSGLVEADRIGHALEAAAALLQEHDQARDQVEAALKISEQRLLMAQEGAHVGIWEWEVTTDRVFWSAECHRLYDVPAGSMQNLDQWRALLHPEDLPWIDARFQEWLNQCGDFALEYRIRRRSGAVRWLSSMGRVYCDDSGAPVRLIGINLDITQRKSAEAALQASEQRFSAIFHNVPIGLAMGALDTRAIVDANRSWLDLLGYQRAELIGHTGSDLNMWVDVEARNQFFERLAKGLPISPFETRFRKKSGDLVDVLTTGKVFDLNGTPHVVAMIADITARKRLEAAIRDSESRYRALVETTFDWIWEVDAGGITAMSAPRSSRSLATILRN